MQGHTIFDAKGKVVPDAVKFGTVFDQMMVRLGYTDELYTLKQLKWKAVWTTSGVAIRTPDNEVVGKVAVTSQMANAIVDKGENAKCFEEAKTLMHVLLAKCEDFVPAGAQPDPLAKAKKLFSPNGKTTKVGEYLTQSVEPKKVDIGPGLATAGKTVFVGIDFAKTDENDQTVFYDGVLGHVVAAKVDDKGMTLDIETGGLENAYPIGPIKHVKSHSGHEFWEFDGKKYTTETEAKHARMQKKKLMFSSLYGGGPAPLGKPDKAQLKAPLMPGALSAFVDKVLETGLKVVVNAHGDELELPQLKVAKHDEAYNPIAWTFPLPDDDKSLFGNGLYVDKGEAEKALKTLQKALVQKHLKAAAKPKAKPSAVAKAVEFVDQFSAAVKPYKAVKGTLSDADNVEKTFTGQESSVKVETDQKVLATEGEKMVAQAVPNAEQYKANVKLPIVALKDATKLCQRVHGTSGGSVYFAMAFRTGIKVAVARSDGKLKIRAEGSGLWTPSMQARLSQVTNLFNVYPDSHVSSHIATSGVQAEMAYAGILAALSPNGEWAECLSLNYLPS